MPTESIFLGLAHLNPLVGLLTNKLNSIESKSLLVDLSTSLNHTEIKSFLIGLLTNLDCTENKNLSDNCCKSNIAKSKEVDGKNVEEDNSKSLE